VAVRLGILGLAVGVAVIASILLYGSYAARQGNDKIVPGAGESSRPEASSGGWSEDNVREVQTKLREAGLYFGEIDGVYSSELAAALGRYQIRNGLPITGQLDVDTSKALGAKPAVATRAATREQSSETWRRLLTGEQQTLAKNNAGVAPSPAPDETEISRELPPRSAPAAGTQISGANAASAPPATGSPALDFSTERLRDYVGAFVLAGLDPQVGAEAAFFADRVQYYNQGIKDREKIRADLKRYDSRWPGRKFWLAGDITVKPQTDKRVRVTFPLRYELRNGGKRSSGKVDKTLVLERAGDELQIVTVNERKAE
jgi:peptidoglycan hydrolase-like protein with peptidoglycan-binding domain